MHHCQIRFLSSLLKRRAIAKNEFQVAQTDKEKGDYDLLDG